MGIAQSVIALDSRTPCRIPLDVVVAVPLQTRGKTRTVVRQTRLQTFSLVIDSQVEELLLLLLYPYSSH